MLLSDRNYNLTCVKSHDCTPGLSAQDNFLKRLTDHKKHGTSMCVSSVNTNLASGPLVGEKVVDVLTTANYTPVSFASGCAHLECRDHRIQEQH